MYLIYYLGTGMVGNHTHWVPRGYPMGTLLSRRSPVWILQFTISLHPRELPVDGRLHTAYELFVPVRAHVVVLVDRLRVSGTQAHASVEKE